MLSTLSKKMGKKERSEEAGPDEWFGEFTPSPGSTASLLAGTRGKLLSASDPGCLICKMRAIVPILLGGLRMDSDNVHKLLSTWSILDTWELLF